MKRKKKSFRAKNFASGNPLLNFPSCSHVSITTKFSVFLYKVLDALRSVQVMEHVKMDLVSVVNLLVGEDLCVKYQDAQELERTVVDMVVVIVLTKHAYVIQVSSPMPL